MTGALFADDEAVRETAEAVRIAEECGEDVTLEAAQAHGLVLSRRPTAAERDVALELLRRARDAQVGQRNLFTATKADIRIAELTAEAGEFEGSSKVRAPVDLLFENGGSLSRCCDRCMVETLLGRGSDSDVHEAAAAIERLAAVPTDPGFVLNEISLLRMRALLARAPATTPPIATIGIATAHGEIAWLRGAHRLGRGDAMTTVGPMTTAGVLK